MATGQESLRGHSNRARAAAAAATDVDTPLHDKAQIFLEEFATKLDEDEDELSATTSEESQEGFAAVGNGRPNEETDGNNRMDETESSSSLSSLSSLPELDALRAASTITVVRAQNVDFIRGSGTARDSVDEDIAICHLAYLMPFTRGAGKDRIRSPLANSYKGAAAVLLAAQHLNTGDGSIVAAVDGLSDRCAVRFTVEMFDTELSEATAINHVVRLTDRDPRSEGSILSSEVRPPCAFLGAGRSAVSIPSSIISGLRGYPQVSPISTSADLDDTNQYPLFARTIPADDGTAIPIVLYVRDVLKVEHLAVVHVTDSYGTSFARGLQLAASEYFPDLSLYMFDIPFGATPDVIKRTVQRLKEAGNLLFFGILFPDDAEAIMTEAYKQGIAGTSTGEYNWFFADAIGSGIKGVPYERDSALGQAFRGTSVLQAMGGMGGMKRYDQLGEAMRALDNEEDVAYLKSILPKYPAESLGNDVHSVAVGDQTFFSSLGAMGPFLYDATIALGLAACNATSKGRGESNSLYLDGEKHWEALVQTKFQGTSGNLLLDAETGTRRPESAFFALNNFVEDEDAAVSVDEITFKAVQTHVFEDGQWTELLPFTFNDGTSNLPKDLPHASVDTNYLSPALRGVGLTLCAIILILSIGFVGWTRKNLSSRVVRASQPIFLDIISTGTFMMGSAIIPLSIDLGVASQRGCDAACMSFPWLLSIGFSAIFSALHAKTHRINIILRKPGFKRITVTAMDVIKPMIVIMGGSIIILSVWTALSPLRLETIVTSTDRFGRPTETYGVCTSEKQVPFITTLGTMNVGALMFALYEAYQARAISTEFAESKYILRAVACMLLVCFIGIPVLVIARENPSAYFFVFAGIIFVTSCCILLLIYVPKIVQHRKRIKEKATKKIKDCSMNNHPPSSLRSTLTEVEPSDRALGAKIVNNPYIEELENEIRALRTKLKANEGGDISPEAEALVPNESALQLGQQNTENTSRVTFSTTKLRGTCAYFEVK